jgi:phosphate transport system substrate-binding protein
MKRGILALCAIVATLAFQLRMAQSVNAAPEVLLVPGSGSNEYALTELARAFNAKQDRYRVEIPPSSGTAGGLRALENGSASLVRTGRPLKAAELAKGWTFVPMGRDAVAFVAGRNIRVTSIDRQQMLDIYSGRITDWKSLGGKGRIRVIGRETSDASRTAIGRTIPAFSEMKFGDHVKVVHLDPHMIALLDQYPTSFGFLNVTALKATRTGVKMLAFEGVTPSAARVADGTYPFALETGLAYETRKLADSARAFIQFVQSLQGRQILTTLGMLPPPEDSQ